MCHYIHVFSFVLDLLNRFTENGLETRNFSVKFPNIDFPTSLLHRKVKNHGQLKP